MLEKTENKQEKRPGMSHFLRTTQKERKKEREKERKREREKERKRERKKERKRE